MNKATCLAILFLLSCAVQAGTMAFATKRLQGMATYLHLEMLDTLPVGVCETYKYRGHPLVVRKNKWGEIEHIGLKLFTQTLRETYPLPIYDFLERYLLERNACSLDTEEGFRMQHDHVNFHVGREDAALQLDSTVNFTENHVDLRVYQVTWEKNGKVVLRMSFEMNWQLMSGCDEIELENRFFHLLPLCETNDYVTHRKVIFPEASDYFVRNGDFFVAPSINNNLYYVREDSLWSLVRDVNRPVVSASNMMLNANIEEDLQLYLIMDKYGYKRDTIQVSYRKFIQMCIKEGCVPYFGFKQKTEEAYTGTLFLVNRTGGYLHLLSVVIPHKVIESPKTATINGVLYAYISLYNLSDKMINPAKYVNKE